MSKQGFESPYNAFDETLLQIIELDEQIGELQLRRRSILRSLLEKMKEGLPDNEMLAAWVLYHGGNKESGDSLAAKIDRLKELASEIEANRGKPILWISQEEEIIAYRDPGPNQTEYRQNLNIGLLPADAKLRVSPWECKIPIERAVKIRLLSFTTEDPAQYSDLEARLMGNPRWVDIPAIHLSPNGPYSIINRKMTKDPWPIINDQAIKELFDQHSLDERPEIVGALNILTESLSGSKRER